MSRLVLMETDGSPSQELQSLAAGLWLDIVEGGIHALPSVRGENVTIPGKPGQTVMPFVADSLGVKVGGAVWGIGATAVLRRAAYRTRVAAIRTILGNVGKVVRLVAHPPVEGLITATTATIDAQVVRFILPTAGGWESQEHMEIHLECVTNPPAWTIA